MVVVTLDATCPVCLPQDQQYQQQLAPARTRIVSMVVVTLDAKARCSWLGLTVETWVATVPRQLLHGCTTTAQ